MGAQLSLSARTSPSIALFSYIDVLNEVHYVSQLNSSMFLKTCKGLDPNGEVIIKVFIKPTEHYDLKQIQQAIIREALELAPLPTALNFSKVIESTRAGYLIRQHLQSNLYDRLSSRPYLLDIELTFMTFQLLQALEDVHNANITHGDIKTENILVTSWNWLLLTDFSSSIKPTFLPEDNPGEFSFYFDTSKRRTCYLAPERFDSRLHANIKNSSGQVSKKMDIFSMGCCIAEMHAEGRPLFNLAQLFKYKNHDYDIDLFLNEEIKSRELRNLIRDMIQLDPDKRLSTKEIMEKYRGSFFPDYFYTFTYEYFRSLATMGTSTPSTGSICAHMTLGEHVNVVDTCCSKLYTDFKKVCESLGYTGSIDQKFVTVEDMEQFFSPVVKLAPLGTLELGHFDSDCTAVKEECALLFVSYISHALRNVVSSVTKLRCIEMLVAFSQFISDDNKIDRVIPYLVSCFEDEYPNVQALAVQALTQVLHFIEGGSVINEFLFVDYLFPRVKRLLQQSKQKAYIRIVVANCLGDFVIDANRFQELFDSSKFSEHSENPNTGMEPLENANKHIKKLIQQVEELTVGLLTDNEKDVKIALLSNILPLCKFFGRERTNDVILSHLITYLNDKDSSLRIKLIQTISGIAVLLGPITLEQYILPLLIQTITDSEELVVVNVLKSLRDLCKTGLIQKRFYYDICNTIASLLLHPNFWIRQYSLLLIVEVSDNLSKAEVYCVLYPILRPFFEFDVEFTYDLMLSSCKQPVTRTVYNLLCSWSLRASKSLFWQQVPSNHVDAFGNNNTSFITKDHLEKNYGFNAMKASKSVVRSFDNSEIPLTTEDKNWVDKFKSIGLLESDLWKLGVLRSYVLRTAKLISRKVNLLDTRKSTNSESTDHLNLLLPHVLPRTVFFDIKFVEDEETTVKSPDNKDKSSISQKSMHRDVLPSVKDMNGSLMVAAKASATTTSNLENVYVQLECKPSRGEDSRHSLESDNGKQEFVLHDTYEGDIQTVKDFLRNLNILPSMKEYKEFGPVMSDATISNTLSNIEGKFVANLLENGPHAITAIAISSGAGSHLISGSDQGMIKLWDISEIVAGEVYTSSVTQDFGSPITDIITLNGYDAFCIATKEGFIIILRILYQGSDTQKRFSAFQTIRKFKIIQTGDKEEYAVRIKAVITEDRSNLIALTNTSQIIVLDIRTMNFVQKITNPVAHGAVLSFALGEDGSVLILGTTKGIIDIWDLRFKMLIRSWTFGDHQPISHLQESGPRGKESIIVVGGFSSAVFTIWNYCKMKCTIAVIDSDEQPSIENFLPIEKNLDQLKFQGPSKTRSLYANANNIIVADYLRDHFIKVDTKKLAASRIIDPIRKSSMSSYLIPIQATASLTFLLVGKINESTVNAASETCFNDTVNCMTSTRINGGSLLITADNSGVISIIS